MGKFINTAHTDTINAIVEGGKQRLKNPYYLFTDKKATIVTYYNINTDKSTVDEGTKNAYSFTDGDSPFRFNKIENAYLFGIPRIETDLQMGEYGLESESIEGTAYIAPNTFQPYPQDYFYINHVDDSHMVFKVMSVSMDTFEDGANFWRIDYKLSLADADPDRLEDLVVDTFVMNVSNFGTNIKAIIKKSEYDFIEALESSIGNIDDAEGQNVMNMMISRTSERISGLLVRDSQGRFVLSLGASPAGVQMPSPEARRSMSSPDIALSRFSLSYQNSIKYTDIEVPAPSYTIEIVTFPGTGIPVRAEIVETEDAQSMLVSLPAIVADQDIAGTIRIAVDGETVGYIDVLVYRIDYYRPTLFATKELLFAFLISIPSASDEAAIRSIAPALSCVFLYSLTISASALLRDLYEGKSNLMMMVAGIVSTSNRIVSSSS